MKTTLSLLAIICLFTLSCSSNTKNEQAKQETLQMDSISADMQSLQEGLESIETDLKEAETQLDSI